jgi:hypothetical protein
VSEKKRFPRKKTGPNLTQATISRPSTAIDLTFKTSGPASEHLDPDRRPHARSLLDASHCRCHLVRDSRANERASERKKIGRETDGHTHSGTRGSRRSGLANEVQGVASRDVRSLDENAQSRMTLGPSALKDSWPPMDRQDAGAGTALQCNPSAS